MRTRSRGRRQLPVGINWSVISHYFSVGGPHCQDGFFSADARPTWVSSRSKPVILRSSSSPSSVSNIRHSVSGLPQHLIQEQNIIGDHTSSQVMFHSVDTVNHSVNFPIFVGHNQLERAEQFLSASVEVLHKLVQRHFDGCRLVGSIAGGDCVVLQLLASEG